MSSRQTQTHTHVQGGTYTLSAVLPGGPKRGGGRAGDFYACLYLMNHMQMRWRMSHKRVIPQRLWEEGHKDSAFWAAWSPGQASGLKGPEAECAHPHQGAGSRSQDQLQCPCCCGRGDPSGRGRTVPVDGVLEGRGLLPGQMVSRLPALEAKWILMKSQPWC